MESHTPITRRTFGRTVALAGAAAIAPSWLRAHPHHNSVPPLGCQNSLENAATIHSAGGSWLGLSVAGWLQPDGPEDEWQTRLAAARKSPIPVLACNSFIRRKDLKCNGPDANHDEILDYAHRAFHRAQEAGVKMITFGSSGSRRLPEGFDYERGLDQFITLLKRLGPLAADHDLIVQVEQLQQREVNFINRIGEMEHVVRAADHPNIRGVADLFHMVIEGDTPEDLARAADLVNHVEIAEKEGRRIPGATDQDFRPYFEVLKDAGYHGRIGIEGKYEIGELAGGFATITRQWKEA